MESGSKTNNILSQRNDIKAEAKQKDALSLSQPTQETVKQENIRALNTNRFFQEVTSVVPEIQEEWNSGESAKLYGIDTWGSGYFRINKKGNVCITPQGKLGPQVDLLQLMEDLCDRGIRPPILIRFPDIIRSRIQLLASCFSSAMAEYGYKGKYQGVFPIKVNQQNHVVSEIIKHGKMSHLGLECGSKPELLIALGMIEDPESLIICNGFKDSEYIQTALLSQKLGRNTIIVVDRYSELVEIVKLAKILEMKPKIGFRAKLESKGSGKWIDSSGARSKFGLTPPEIVAGAQLLKSEGLLDSLILLHYHIGSQINSIQAIKSSIKEGARYYTEMRELGAPVQYVDVGGGLGVDYDGTGRGYNSVNYDEKEYANDVVSIIQSVCDEKEVPHPVLITESGRSLVAHHSILVFNVLGVNEVTQRKNGLTVSEEDHEVLKNLLEIYEKVSAENLHEFYHDTLQLKNDTHQLFTFGYLNLEQRAKAEKIVWGILTKMAQITENMEDAKEISDNLRQELSDTYYCNFSVFQSLPDSWAVEQLFPVMPIHRLNEKPSRKAVLVDLTCDSDGKIDQFIEYEDKQSALSLHDYTEGKPYYLGTFLLGAYQEILGDLHNLFGDTDAVTVGINEVGYTIEHVEEGDTVSEVLNYVQYTRGDLVSRMRKHTEEGIRNKLITTHEARLLMKNYEDGLSGYTYLEE